MQGIVVDAIVFGAPPPLPGGHHRVHAASQAYTPERAPLTHHRCTMSGVAHQFQFMQKRASRRGGWLCSELNCSRHGCTLFWKCTGLPSLFPSMQHPQSATCTRISFARSFLAPVWRHINSEHDASQKGQLMLKPSAL